MIHDNKRYELVYSTRWEKPKKPLIEQMAEAMEDIEECHRKLREHSKHLKALR